MFTHYAAGAFRTCLQRLINIRQLQEQNACVFDFMQHFQMGFHHVFTTGFIFRSLTIEELVYTLNYNNVSDMA